MIAAKIRTIQPVITAVCAILFEAEFRRLNSNMDKIITNNNDLLHAQYDGLIHNGTRYRLSNIIKGYSGFPAAHPELWDAVVAHSKDMDRVDHDNKMIKQILFKLTTDCISMQDLRDALPDCLANLVDKLHLYDRTREEAYTISNDERAVRQYITLRPKIEFYCMARLIY